MRKRKRLLLKKNIKLKVKIFTCRKYFYKAVSIWVGTKITGLKFPSNFHLLWTYQSLIWDQIFYINGCDPSFSTNGLITVIVRTMQVSRLGCTCQCSRGNRTPHATYIVRHTAPTTVRLRPSSRTCFTYFTHCYTY